MAHAATLSTLADGLIQSITGWTPEKDARRLKQGRDLALRSFRSQLHARVNQFDVQSRLDGLEEKFIVLNRLPLADALRTRRDELAKRSSKWTPEILSLLLSLSDRPVDNTDLSVLEVNDEVTEDLPQLSWADIIAEDPLTEEGVWDDIVIDSDFSDEDAGGLSDDSPEDETVSTQASSLGEEDIAAFARSFIVSKDDSTLDHVTTHQDDLRQSKSDKGLAISTRVTDLCAIREALLMLRGLPTILFVIDSSSKIHPQPSFTSASCSSLTYKGVMQEFASLGSQLGRLRTWVAQSTMEGELSQRFKAVVQLRCSAFDKDIAQIEQQLLAPHIDVVVSMSDVLCRVQHHFSPLQCLSTAIFRPAANHGTWNILDSLFATACDLHMDGMIDDFVYIATIFFECLEVYLRPVHLWTTQGKLQDVGDSTFFVRATDETPDLASLWDSAFELSLRSDGTVNAPSFMQSAANQIFVSGKSTMFLNALHREEVNPATSMTPMRSLNADYILESTKDSLLPFAGVFETELRKWINGLQSHSMITLREALFSQCGLKHTLRVISNVFLAGDGAQFQYFADELFTRLDQNRPWTDRFILTDLAQNTLGGSKYINPERLLARLAHVKSSDSRGRGLPIEAIDRILLDYTISWPLKNVVKDFKICQLAFSTSLRVYRVEYLIKKQQWSLLWTTEKGNSRLSKAVALRQRLIWFVNTFRGYITDTTSITMREFENELEKASDVDGMALAYDNFQQNLEARLLLRKNLRPIYQAFVSLLNLCENFAVLWAHMVEADGILSRHDLHRTATSPDADFSDEESPRELEELGQQPVHDPSALIKEFERQLHFAAAGLRSVSRVGGESSWISLAERLQLGAEHVNRG